MSAVSALFPPQRLQAERDNASTTLSLLWRSPVFWSGLLVKLVLAAGCGSRFPTRWFAPFVAAFVRDGFANPWTDWFARGEVQAFPYGPGMLAILTPSFLPGALIPFDASGHIGLFLLRVPVVVADVLICVLLIAWLRVRVSDALVTWWWSPIVLYAAYFHGQLDIIPTAIALIALALTLSRRTLLGAVVLGVGIATKHHLLLLLPFLWVYVARLQRPLGVRLGWGFVVVGTAALLFAPLLGSSAFRSMVFGTPEAERVWQVVLPFGADGPQLYLAPAAVLVVFARYASFRKLNRELVLGFIGLAYVVLVALVRPAPGWFLWSLPFLAQQAASDVRTGRRLLGLLSVAYLAYFFVDAPRDFLESIDPSFGDGVGAALVRDAHALLPLLFSPRVHGVVFTLLVATTLLTAFVLYRHRIQTSPFYRYRDQPFLIGLAGDSASGKHSLAQSLGGVFGRRTLRVLFGDDDHRWARGHEMWQRHTHLDPRGNFLDLQAEHLAALKRGQTIVKRSYDHATGNFTDPDAVDPADFVLILGLHPFYLRSQREILDLKIFLDPREELRVQWKTERDHRERGHSLEAIAAEVSHRSRDSLQYIRPQRQHADLILSPGSIEPGQEENVEVLIEMDTSLGPMSFLDLISAGSALQTSWEADDSLERDRLSLSGQLPATETARLAHQLGAGEETFIVADRGWLPGTRGVLQLAVIYAVLRRLHA